MPNHPTIFLITIYSYVKEYFATSIKSRQEPAKHEHHFLESLQYLIVAEILELIDVANFLQE